MWYEDAVRRPGVAGRERALSGYERSASRQSRAGQKAVELPPACRQAAQGIRKLEAQPRRKARRRRFADHPAANLPSCLTAGTDEAAVLSRNLLNEDSGVVIYRKVWRI